MRPFCLMLMWATSLLLNQLSKLEQGAFPTVSVWAQPGTAPSLMGDGDESWCCGLCWEYPGQSPNWYVCTNSNNGFSCVPQSHVSLSHWKLYSSEEKGLLGAPSLDSMMITEASNKAFSPLPPVCANASCNRQYSPALISPNTDLLTPDEIITHLNSCSFNHFWSQKRENVKRIWNE